MKFLLLIDDHDMLRTGIADWMRHNSDWRVAGQAASVKEAAQLIDSVKNSESSVYVAVVDLSLKEPGSDDNTLGYSVLKMIKDSGKDIRSVVYSSFDTGAFINRATSQEYGALGYVSKNSGINILLDAVNEAAKDIPYIQQELKQHARETLSMLDALTKKEQAVIACMAEGLGNQEASERLGISVRTLENHLSHIYDKTGSSDKSTMLAKLGLKTDKKNGGAKKVMGGGYIINGENH